MTAALVTVGGLLAVVGELQGLPGVSWAGGALLACVLADWVIR